MLGDGGLPDPELAADDLDDLSGRMLAPAENLQDAPPHGIGENVERVHHAPV